MPRPVPPHATTARYVRGCRCARCLAAVYGARIRRERAQLHGTWAPFADAAPVREHVAALVRAGLTEKNIAALAGVAHGSVLHLLYGTGGLPPGRRIRPGSARRLLAVRPASAAIPPTGMIPATGTVRRLQALVAKGWPVARLAGELGMEPTNLAKLMRQNSKVRAGTAAAVRALYDRLWNTPPAQETPVQRKYVAQAARHAAKRGWAPPLAWDDDQIDDPSASPAEGWKRGRFRPAGDTAAEFAELASRGYSRSQAAERMGISRDALDLALVRVRRRAAIAPAAVQPAEHQEVA